MSRPTALAVPILIAALVTGLMPRASSDVAASTRWPKTPPFPAGAGREIAERGCVLCHSSMLVVQQAKDSTGWVKTVTLMEKWGAPVAPAQHDSLIVYLVRHFGPRTGR